jgi:hypothetical protein
MAREQCILRRDYYAYMVGEMGDWITLTHNGIKQELWRMDASYTNGTTYYQQEIERLKVEGWIQDYAKEDQSFHPSMGGEGYQESGYHRDKPDS